MLDAVREAYAALAARTTRVAVRSSAVGEDAADASFAGEHDTYLELRGADAVADAVARCWASLYTARAVVLPAAGGRGAGAMAVVVQEMVPARAAGVFMTLNPANGDRSTVVCEAVWGLGEPLVSGEVTPDRFVLDKVSGEIAAPGDRRQADAAGRAPTSGGHGRRRRPARATARPPLPRPTPSSPSCCAVGARRRAGRPGRPQDGEFAVADRRTASSTCSRPARRRSGRAAAPRSVDRAPARRSAPCWPPSSRTLTRSSPRGRPAMAADRFPSPFDIATPAGAEGWESMYDWYHLFGPERRELDEQRFWFADRLHHPDVLHPYDEIQCECWWQALGAFNTRIFAMPPAFGVDQRILNGRLYVTPVPAPPEDIAARAEEFGKRAGHYYERWDAIYDEWKRQGHREARGDPRAALRPAARPRARGDRLRAHRDTPPASG